MHIMQTERPSGVDASPWWQATQLTSVLVNFGKVILAKETISVIVHHLESLYEVDIKTTETPVTMLHKQYIIDPFEALLLQTAMTKCYPMT